MEQFVMENGKTVYLYVPQAVKEQSEGKVPLVLFMCGTTCDPVENCVDSGWTRLAEKENFIVVSPDYNNSATYSETDFLISVVEFNNYYKKGYSVPFAQLVIVEDSEHRPRKEEAEVAWDFFKNFKRNQDGEIVVYGGDIDRSYRDVVYDTLSDSQTLDLYLPETGTGPFPLIVFIHGGGWYGGDKADGQEDAFVALREQGYAVASINYRLSGEAAHPAGLIDCKTAIRYLKANAEQYWLDPDHFAVSGDSSGGHYALMVALTAGNSDFEDLTRGYAAGSASTWQCGYHLPYRSVTAVLSGSSICRWRGTGVSYNCGRSGAW